MGLSSIFKREACPSSSGELPDEVQQARTRARRRLIGAVVLLGIGIVGFPIVFETQPRPIPVDIPIEIPRKEGAAPLTLPPKVAAAPEAIITEPREEAVPPPIAGPGPAADARPVPETRPAAGARPAPDARPTADVKSAAPAKPSVEDGARARALLEGASAASSSQSPRFVVQVGAFADAGAANDTRQKMEKLGLKTYTQVASTAAGGRIRVRVGPFPTRDEADRALARARGAGLAGVVITL